MRININAARTSPRRRASTEAEADESEGRVTHVQALRESEHLANEALRSSNACLDEALRKPDAPKTMARQRFTISDTREVLSGGGKLRTHKGARQPCGREPSCRAPWHCNARL